MTMDPNTPDRRTAVAAGLWMLVGSFVFSIMSALANALGNRVDWQVVAIARSGVAFVLALGLALSGGATLVFLRPGMLWVRSLSGSVSLVCTFYALTHLPLAEVLTITNTFPVWLALLSWPMLGERPGLDVWVASLMGVAGVALIKQPWNNGGDAIDWLPVAAAFMAAWSTAVAMLGLNRLGHLDTRSVVAHFSAVATVVSIVSLWLFPRECSDSPVFSGDVPWLLAGVGLTATAGQLCLTRAFTTGTASSVAVVGLSQVLFAAAIDWMAFSRPLNATAIIGMAFVLLPTGHVILQRPTR
ncbi:MAG: DMT family transporter [Planctomycetes bacterium]|nr:DMT family transporter [Planctomycetota bacterium]